MRPSGGDSRPDTVNCAWCGEPVPVARKGPVRMYCGKAHKELAYLKRRSASVDAGMARAEAQTHRLAQALAFYADPSNYVSAVQQDGGRLAREALAGCEPDEEPAP
jgi:hypothetical protein